MTAPRDTRIGVLLLSQFSFMQLGQVVEPLFIANWLLREKRFQWQLLSMNGGTVHASSAIPIDTLVIPDSPAGFNVIFVVASFETKLLIESHQIKLWLRQAAQSGVILCGIEGGTEVLAAAGLLDGSRATVHWDNFDGFQERHADVQACMNLYVAQGRYLSCAGGTAVLDFMLDWLRPRVDRSIFRQLQAHLLQPRIRNGEIRQDYSAADNHERLPPVVQRATELMMESMMDPVPLRNIAAELGISVRQLERRFRATLQTSPAKYYLQQRIVRAHRLLQQTNLPVYEIAAATGFQSLEHFSRSYRKHYGRTPSKDRLQTTEAPSIPGPYFFK